jgi:hypothetical protein
VIYSGEGTKLVVSRFASLTRNYLLYPAASTAELQQSLLTSLSDPVVSTGFQCFVPNPRSRCSKVSVIKKSVKYVNVAPSTLLLGDEVGSEIIMTYRSFVSKIRDFLYAVKVVFGL